MTPFYIKHLLCAIVDNHFGDRLPETDDETTLTVTVSELLYAMRSNSARTSGGLDDDERRV